MSLNYNHDILSNRINSSLPPFISEALRKRRWGGEVTHPEIIKMRVGAVPMPGKAASSRLKRNAHNADK